VSVARGHVQDDGGYSWTVTFTSATGDIPEMQAKSQLHGIGAAVSVSTQLDGNSISGSFQLSMFGHRTAPIRHDASADSRVEV